MQFFSSSSQSLEGLETHFNPSGWGPKNGDPLSAFEDIPYAHFDKKDKTSRAADFAQQIQRTPFKFRNDNNMNPEFGYRHDSVEDSSFQLVDTSKTQTKKYSSTKKTWGQQAGRGGAGGRGGRGTQGGRGGGRGTGVALTGGTGATAGGRGSRGKATGRGGRGGRGQMRRHDRKFDRQPSLTVLGDWEVVEEFDLPQLLKLQTNPPVVEDLVWAGHLDMYDESWDKVNSKNAKLLRKAENKIFYYVTTSEDPVLEKFAVEGTGNVFATDAILSHLMTAHRSVYSWDIVIQKLDGNIYMDKRENSTFDLLTVSETSQDPPVANDDIEEYNHPDKLSIEATTINQNFSQQILRDDESCRKSYQPNPFFDPVQEGESNPGDLPSVAYRYRKFTLGNIKIVARCELHGWAQKQREELLFTSYALNEWDSRYAGGIDWKRKIDTQRGAVLATELKNNSCKLAKWTAQSILSGADIMKVGYVSRLSKANAHEHTILATQVFKPKELSQQINLNMFNMWGIVKMIAELVMTQADGKYVLMKDPNKATIRLYSVPLHTFEEEEEEEEEEEAEGNEEGDEEVDFEEGDEIDMNEGRPAEVAVQQT